MTSQQIVIGTYHERESREITHNHTSYAADWQTVKTVAGDYPVRLTFEGGYLCPMPYWLLVAIDAEITDGRTYSGFGGFNTGSREVVRESTKHRLQMYDYSLAKLLADGTVTLLPEFEFLADVYGDSANHTARIEWAQSLDWEWVFARKIA
jgi:hypothetical protein